MREETEEFPLPDLEAEYSEEEGERLDMALEKYNEIRQGLADTQVRDIQDRNTTFPCLIITDSNSLPQMTFIHEGCHLFV